MSAEEEELDTDLEEDENSLNEWEALHSLSVLEKLEHLAYVAGERAIEYLEDAMVEATMDFYEDNL